MSKGLEATKRLKWGYAISQEERINLCECIEKELKQAQEDKEVLNIFKNALAIKHTCVLPKEQDQDDTFSYACRYLFEITQNDIDEKLRKSLREWVLKNAFPKELKALEVIKNSKMIIQEFINGKIEINLVVDKEEYNLITEALNGLL